MLIAKSPLTTASIVIAAMLCLAAASCRSPVSLDQSQKAVTGPIANLQATSAPITAAHAAFSRRTYAISDLVFVPADYSNEVDMTQPKQLQRRNASANPDAKASRIADIERYITDNIELGSWEVNGGAGTVSADPAKLELQITQTEAVQQKIKAFLDDWREKRSTQISIETRYLVLDDAAESKLEAGLQRRLRMVSTAGNQRHDQFLSNQELNALILGVRAISSATNLTAPRLTLYNGQRATLAVETQQAYVADLALVPAKSGAIYDPTVKNVIADGFTLNVSACASSDFRDVFVDLRHQSTRLVALLPERFGPNAAIKPGVMGTIQRPVESTFTADAVCPIPDKMTLLLGGVTGFTAGDSQSNAHSPDRQSVDQKVQQLGEENAHRHYYLLIKPTILRNRPMVG